jgi:hypothetical protein
VDPERIAAILNYSAPRNQKQLRQFLGTCNYHHIFIINYTEYVTPLLGLLKKGTKWKWTPEMQTAFESLREKFANTIHLIEPNEKTSVYYTYGCQLQSDRRGLDAERFGRQCQHSFDSFTGIAFCGKTLHYL